jgi:isopentenyl-diphosphate delta-isomerase
MRENLILVNERNRAVGRAGKAAVHKAGLLHRAFSIFLVGDGGRLLLQRRSRAKYHSAGLWANSCCGHPRVGESTATAARRRLGEELGADASLHFAFKARYCTVLSNGLTENELVYVYFGQAPAALSLNPAEVSATGWMTLPELLRDIERHPRRYAYWLRYYMKNHYAAIQRGVKRTHAASGKTEALLRLPTHVTDAARSSAALRRSPARAHVRGPAPGETV